jgi:hypothetical protein
MPSMNMRMSRALLAFAAAMAPTVTLAASPALASTPAQGAAQPATNSI